MCTTAALLRRLRTEPRLALRPRPRPRATASVRVGLAVAATLTTATLARADDSARDVWYLILIQGQPAGWAQEAERALEDGGVETTLSMRFAMRRGADVARSSARTVTREDAQGRVSEFTVDTSQSNATLRMEGRIVDDTTMRVEMRLQGLADPRVVERPYDARAIGPRATWRRLRAELRKAGDALELVSFLPDQLQCAAQRFELGAEEDVEVDGARRRLRRMRSRVEIGPGIAIDQWVDESFEPWKVAMDIGVPMEFHRTTRERVLERDYSSPPEVFLSSAIPLDHALPRRLDRSRFRLRRREERDPPFSLRPTDTAGQVVRELRPGVWEVTVRRVEPSEVVRRPIASSTELAPFLAANEHIQSDAQRIVQLAKRIVGDETDAWAAARSLERWVHANIEDKNLETAFATALEVLETRRGDCTEHAVLLAALARAAGIPARVVVGLVAHRKSLVGHMWTEVWIGEWVPLDATRGRGTVDADRIALGASPLGTESLGELFLGLLPALGGLHVEWLGER